MNIFRNKRCPRCSQKLPVEIVVCSSCQLNFQKFNDATNAEAKQAIRLGENDRVLMRQGYPKDVNKITMILLTVFLGFMGAHYYYVGRVKKGAFFTIFFVVGVVNAVLTMLLTQTPKGDAYQVLTFLVLIWGVVLFMWIVDMVKVCFNKFKIPVSREK